MIPALAVWTLLSVGCIVLDWPDWAHATLLLCFVAGVGYHHGRNDR